jgi:hypothetical protein
MGHEFGAVPGHVERDRLVSVHVVLEDRREVDRIGRGDRRRLIADGAEIASDGSAEQDLALVTGQHAQQHAGDDGDQCDPDDGHDRARDPVA